ncbi:hypothetical protein [Burkholderia arboris]|uniref:hypothetical protein n=1 Tax=Burkholderia arboris TaxID=488730 RepID=UPI0030F17AA4
MSIDHIADKASAKQLGKGRSCATRPVHLRAPALFRHDEGNAWMRALGEQMGWERSNAMRLKRGMSGNESLHCVTNFFQRAST